MVLYQDEALVVLNKPTGVFVQGGTKVPASLDKAVAAFLEQARVYVVHRLDRDTSGLLIFAKTLASARSLSQQFKERSVSKTYLAQCEGPPSPQCGVHHSFISKKWRGQEETMVSRKEFEKGSLEALTRYRLLKVMENGNSCVLLQPQTGRTHQLRLHMHDLGCPIVGDLKYGVRENKRLPSGRLCLHAFRLTFTHPLTRRKVSFRADVPHDVLGIP
jgi:23S rRNA pseudouridine955/2504/2580 synthase